MYPMAKKARAGCLGTGNVETVIISNKELGQGVKRMQSSVDFVILCNDCVKRPCSSC
jgi:hypothetical protein